MTIPDIDHRPIQAFVSLKSDRNTPGGGYRDTVRVLSSNDLRGQLLKQAFDDFKHFQGKYEQLTELAPLFEVAARIEKKSSKPSKRSNKRRQTAKV